MIQTFSLLLFLTFTLSGCTAIRRSPSSDKFDEERINRLQEIDLELSKYWNFDWEANQKYFQTKEGSKSDTPQIDKEVLKNSDNRVKIESLQNERELRVSQISSKLNLLPWTGMGPWDQAFFHQPLFEKEEALQINSWEDVELSNESKNPFPLEHRLYKSYSLRFDNLLPLLDKNISPNPYLKAQLKCDGEIIYDDGFLFLSNQKRSKEYNFIWYFNETNSYRVRVKFSPEVTRCQLRFYDQDKSKTYTHGLDLVDLTTLSKDWAKMATQIDVCAKPNGDFGNGPTNFFWKQDFMFTTCPQTISKWKNLREPYSSINQKILSLTGSPLDRGGFDKNDPMINLNFEKAPHFDVLWVSSLIFSADFYGLTLAKALRFHALRGTQIRILVSDVTMTEKDRNILNWISKGNPNVKIQYYKYTLSDENGGGLIDKFHRVNHTKLLIGYSATNSDANFLITGGRNIRDSYIFKKKPFYRRFKFLKNYGDGEEEFIYYDDFEIEIRGAKIVKSVLAQMLSFWMRDPESQQARPTNINLPAQSSPEKIKQIAALSTKEPLVRHIVSIPYADGNKLEKFYLDMIDSSQSELLLTTPYFRPSVAISAALDRAYMRGVKVTVMTRIHLAGDNIPKIAEDVNKEGVNRHLRNINILEWTDEKSILHAKILVIDNKLSFVSSVNMNRRSFIHDTENGLLILNNDVADKLRTEVLNFFKQGRKITSQEKISWIYGPLIDWADSYF
ncbi:MAG: phospholipase D-like domain-containing protein [Pseudobdellovibrionaceae bacterium]